MDTGIHQIRFGYANKKDAQNAKKRLKEYIKENGNITYQELSLIHTINPNYNKLSWDNLDGCTIEKNNSNDGYFLCMPKKILKVKGVNNNDKRNNK